MGPPQRVTLPRQEPSFVNNLDTRHQFLQLSLYTLIQISRNSLIQTTFNTLGLLYFHHCCYLSLYCPLLNTNVLIPNSTKCQIPIFKKVAKAEILSTYLPTYLPDHIQKARGKMMKHITTQLHHVYKLTSGMCFYYCALLLLFL